MSSDIIAKDNRFYKIVRPFVSFIFRFLFHPTVIGLENISQDGRVVLAGNHTDWLDPVMIVSVQKRCVHFLAKEELFRGVLKGVVRGMGCIPVNRKIHDKNALNGAINYLNNDLCIGIFPEGTINRTEDVILPFKIGAVKACFDTNTKLVPFVITGKYNIFGKGVKIEFLKPMSISKDLDKENNHLMKIISKKLIEGEKNVK